MGFGSPLHHKFSMKVRLAIFHWNRYKCSDLGEATYHISATLLSGLKIYTADDISNGYG
jgi:hypothetical protein